MPTYSHLLIILPCHSMEDFPTHHVGEDAEDLLANWTAIWHPALIAGCDALPRWHQADSSDISLDQEKEGGCLVVIPKINNLVINPELRKVLETQEAVIISNESSRPQIIDLAFKGCPDASKLADQVDPGLANDFLALGYAFLQTQIMTRQLRYSSNLDEERFAEAVVTAAQAAVAGDHQNARDGLTRCFDILLEEKNSYYPVEPELLDVVLTAPTTLGISLRRQLTQEHHFNLLLTGRTANLLAEKNPENLRHLTQLISENRATIIGGLEDELPDPLMSTESSINQIRLGRNSIRQHLEAQPAVFLRRRFGLTPSAPGILSQFNYCGAIHATFDDGKFPASSSCNIRWTGDDERSILALGDVPLSAAEAGSFLGLSIRLGEAIDSAHVASVVLVHWPAATCDAFDDLIRITRYSPLFGSFVGLNDYFDTVYDPGYGDTFTSDEYRTPYLKQAIERQTPNPISRFTDYWQQFYKLAQCRSVLVQVCCRGMLESRLALDWTQRIDDYQSKIELQLNTEETCDELPQLIDQLTNQIAQLLVPTEPAEGGPRPATKSELNTDWINVVNGSSFKRRIEMKTDSFNAGTLKQDLPVVFCDSDSKHANWLVEVPGMGSAQINVKSPDTKDQFKADPRVCDERLLRNEFFEVRIDEATGGIRGIQLYGSRINLASQQLAMRSPSNSRSKSQRLTQARYTRMVAEEITAHSDSRFSGTIVSSGQLIDGDAAVANFKQSIHVARGKRVIDVEIQLDLLVEFTSSINHYLCSRLAWKDESARVIANTQETRQQVTSDWFHATNFLEVAQDQNRLAMLTGGLPYHRRTTRRMVDSLLMVAGERQQNFRFGLGVNLGYAMAAAHDWMTPPLIVNGIPTDSGKNQSDWLFHFNCKNILATWWEPFFDDQSRWSGVHIRLRETEGRKGTLGIHCPRMIATGERVNFAGDFVESLEVAKSDPSKLEIAFDRFEFFQISIHWKR